MRKEIVFAIVLGLILGGIIIYGAQLANKSTQKIKSESQTVTPTIDQANSPATNLNITSPINHSISSVDSINITGIAQPNSKIIIYNDNDQKEVLADAKGQFSTSISLDGGMNKIVIGSLSPENVFDSVTIRVVYTTAKILTPTPNPVDSPIASSSQEIVNKTKEDILKKAQDQFKETEQNLTTKAENIIVGYEGLISEIAQNAITIVDDKINLQVSFSSSSAIIKNGKTIKSDQLSIKDNVIVIGNQDENEIIAAKRIVVGNDIGKPTNKKIINAPITKINAKTLSLAVTIDGQNTILVLDKKLKLDLTKITVDQKIFGLILPNDNPAQPATLLLAKII